MAPTPTSVEPTSADEADPPALWSAESFWEEVDGEEGRQLTAPEEPTRQLLQLALMEGDAPLHRVHPDSFFLSLRSTEKELHDVWLEKQQAQKPLTQLANASWRRPRDAPPPLQTPLLRPIPLRPGDKRTRDDERPGSERPSKAARGAAVSQCEFFAPLTAEEQ